MILRRALLSILVLLVALGGALRLGAALASATVGAVTEYGIPTYNSDPFGIASGSDKNLWFTEMLSDKVGRVSTSGSFTEYPLSNGSQPVAIAAGVTSDLWFTEAHANRIGHITTAGALTEYQLSTPSSAPVGIVTGSDGNLWSTEEYGDKVARISTN